MLVPWPPMNLVAECSTMSAPHSIGRHRNGVAKVLSTSSGIPCSWAMAATRLRCPARCRPGCRWSRRRTPWCSDARPPSRRPRSSGLTQVSSTDILRSRCFSWLTDAAVERRRRHHVVAGRQQREERAGLRGDAAGERDRAAPALEARHPLLEHGHRRVHDARVGVAVLLQVEVRRGRFGVLEHVAGGLVDRHRPGAGVRIGTLPCVHLTRLEPEATGLFHEQ